MEKERLQQIYRKTDGYCHICHIKLSFSNYGVHGAKGAWHIEHSKAKANGGSNHFYILFPACISCNIEKGVKHTRTARAKYGNTRAPYSKAKKEALKNNNTTRGVLVGGGIGLTIGGPFGGLIGSIIGGLIGNNNSPNK